MKKIIVISIVLQLKCFFILLGQEDSIKINGKDTLIKEVNLQNKKDYLDLNFRKETRLLKFGVSPFNYIKKEEETTSGSAGAIFSYEQKIIPSLSYIIDANFDYHYGSSPEFESSKFGLGGSLGMRFYYSMDRRIRMSEGANNFHSNYLGVSISKNYYTSNTSVWLEPQHEYENIRDILLINFQWGMQRRIGKYGFYDFSPYFAYKLSGDNNFYETNIYFGAKFIFGLAWGK